MEHLRHACRGILVRDGSVLLCYEPNNDIYIIPGGGIEGNETCAECCEREMLEETGIKVRAKAEYLEIEELFDVWRHINHYFICELVEDTGCQHLTEAEKLAGYKVVWMSMQQAIELFKRSDHPARRHASTIYVQKWCRWLGHIYKSYTNAVDSLYSGTWHVKMLMLRHESGGTAQGRRCCPYVCREKRR